MTDCLLQMTHTCPALLHSMGNVLRACPCGCRQRLSDALLRSQGLHGVLVRSQNADIGFRHLHPAEASFLTGLLVTFRFGDDLRACLTQIGQVASPFQAHWMLRHLQALVGVVDFGDIPLLQEQLVNSHLRSHWRSWELAHFGPSRPVCLDFLDGPSVEIALAGPTRVSDLLLAEVRLGNQVQSHMLRDALCWMDLADWIVFDRVTCVPRIGAGLEFVFGLEHERRRGLDDLTMHAVGLAFLRCRHMDACHFLSPLNLARLQLIWPELAVDLIAGSVSPQLEQHGFFLLDSHWIYFWFRVENCVLHVHWFDGLQRVSPPSQLVSLLHLIQHAWMLVGISWTFHLPIPQTSGCHCGAIAFLNMGFVLGLWPQYSEELAILVCNALLVESTRVGGGRMKLVCMVTWLETFLPSKGVPTVKATDRAKFAVRKLGLPTLQSAIQQKDPWRALRQAGNSLGKPFQWVTYDELQGHIEARAHDKVNASKHAGGKGSKARSTKRNDPVVALSPETVTFSPYFCGCQW